MVVEMHFAGANNGILAGDDPILDRSETDNILEMKRVAEERLLHGMAKVHNILDMWLGSHNRHTIHEESRAQNKQITAVGYISDTEDSIRASWSNFQHEGAAALKLSERSSLPPGLSAKELAGGQTQVLNVRRIRLIDCHSAESDDNSAPKAFPTLKIGSTGMETWIIQSRAKTTVRQTMNPIWSYTTASRMRNALSSGMCVLLQMCPDWFG